MYFEMLPLLLDILGIRLGGKCEISNLVMLMFQIRYQQLPKFDKLHLQRVNAYLPMPCLHPCIYLVVLAKGKDSTLRKMRK